MAPRDAESRARDPPEHPAGAAVRTPRKSRNPGLTVILASILLEFQVFMVGLDSSPLIHLQLGPLWHADHVDIPQSPSPVSAVPPVARCSRTAIGSWLSMVRYALIAAPRPPRRPSRWTMFVPVADRPRTTGRTTWFSPAGTATRPRRTRRWSLFSCSAEPVACSSCITG